MAKGKGGTWVFAAVLVGAIALAGNDGSSSTSSSSSSNTSSSSAQGFSFDLGFGSDQGGTCAHTTTFTSSQGRYTIPSNDSDDPVTARDCTLDQDHGGGATVKTLQQALNQCNGAHLAVDGDYGAGTAQAVSAFQGSHGLTADGTYGPATAGKLAWPTTPDSGKTICAAHPA